MVTIDDDYDDHESEENNPKIKKIIQIPDKFESMVKFDKILNRLTVEGSSSAPGAGQWVVDRIPTNATSFLEQVKTVIKPPKSFMKAITGPVQTVETVHIHRESTKPVQMDENMDETETSTR